MDVKGSTSLNVFTANALLVFGFLDTVLCVVMQSLLWGATLSTTS